MKQQASHSIHSITTTSGEISSHTDRRAFLKASMSAILAAMLPPSLAAASTPHDRHVLSLHNLHTGESLRVCYRANGILLHRALGYISRLMRDHRTGEIKSVDPGLLDQLHFLVREINPRNPISIISGYRSPSTNAALRKTTRGVARKSLHMEGRAIDIRIPGCQTARLRRLAVNLRCGGVGYYPESDFVHLDTGPIKVW